MSRGTLGRARPFAVWVGVTAATAAAAQGVPGAWRAAADASPAQAVDHALVAACATGFAVSLAWLWLVTTVTVAEVVTGKVSRGGGAARRLVLLACGAAVVAGTAVPGHAAGGEGAEVLAGLPLPERTVAAHAPARPGDPYVVRLGDSLWSIAEAHAAPGTDVESRWRDIWRHNRDVVGPDPDLIRPGQVLRLPVDTDMHTDPPTEEDGERR